MWAELSSRCSGSSIFNFSRVFDFDPFLIPFLHPCWTLVRFNFGANRRLGPVPAGPLLSPYVSFVILVTPLLAHGSLFACPSTPFAALGLHFWRPCGIYLVVFEVSLTSISFSMHHIQTRNQPAPSLVTVKVSHPLPIQSVSQI